MATVNLTISGGDKMAGVLSRIASQLDKAAAVRVGFLENATYSVDASKDKPALHVAQVAFWNEFGTVRAPPRPFFRGMIAAKSSKWGEKLGRVAVENGYDAKKTLGQMGEGIAGQLKQSIVDFTTPPNAPSTIARKRGASKVLVDTGKMLRSVDYEVKSA